MTDPRDERREEIPPPEGEATHAGGTHGGEAIAPDMEEFETPEAERAPGDAIDFEREFGDLPDEGFGNGFGDRAELESLQRQLVERTRELAQREEDAKRLQADFQNFRKRVEQQSVVVRRQAVEGFALKLIPVLDNFGRAIATLGRGASAESVVAGLGGVEKQLLSALASEGIVRVEAVGKPFDPTYHEALGTVDAPGHEAETVVEELEAGYTLGDKVVRPARVRLAS